MREFFDNSDYEEEGDFSEESQNDLRLENELRKIKLTLERGASFPDGSSSDLPPEIENQFLDYIQQFEQEFARKKMILVYDLAGQPEYVPVTQLDNESVAPELDKLLEVLNKHSISVDTICEVDKIELYRFITEELFSKETNDIRIPGMIHGFVYEEYHPNHKHDIQNRCGEFVRQVLDLEKELRTDLLSLADEINLAGSVLAKNELVKKVGFFRDAFSSFTIEQLDLLDVTLADDEKRAQATYHIRYTAALDGSYDTMSFHGHCSFALTHDTDWWLIDNISIPGLAV